MRLVEQTCVIKKSHFPWSGKALPTLRTLHNTSRTVGITGIALRVLFRILIELKETWVFLSQQQQKQ